MMPSARTPTRSKRWTTALRRKRLGRRMIAANADQHRAEEAEQADQRAGRPRPSIRQARRATRTAPDASSGRTLAGWSASATCSSKLGDRRRWRRPPWRRGRGPCGRSARRRPCPSSRPRRGRWSAGRATASISRWVEAARVIVSAPTHAVDVARHRPSARRWSLVVTPMRARTCAKSAVAASAGATCLFPARVDAYSAVAMTSDAPADPKPLFVAVGDNPARAFGMAAAERAPRARGQGGAGARATRRSRAARPSMPTSIVPGTRRGCGRSRERPGSVLTKDGHAGAGPCRRPAAIRRRSLAAMRDAAAATRRARSSDPRRRHAPNFSYRKLRKRERPFVLPLDAGRSGTGRARRL